MPGYMAATDTPRNKRTTTNTQKTAATQAHKATA